VTIRGVLRAAAKAAAGSLALLAVVIVGGKDSALAAQSVTLSVPTTILARGQLQASGANTSSNILDPGTTQTNGTFLATNMDVLRVNMVIQVENELMRVTALTEGGLSPDTITVNRGTAGGFDPNGVVAHTAPKSIFRNINFVPVTISTVATENGGNLTAALSAAEFENTGARVGEAINSSVTLFRIDTVDPLFTGRTLLIDSEKMLVADGPDLDAIATYPGWLDNSGATISMITDEHLASGMCNNGSDDDGDGKVNDGCAAAGNTVVTAEAGAECNDAVDQNGFDTSGTGYEDDDADGTHNEAWDDGDQSKINDGCPLNEATLRISDAGLIAPGWTIQVEEEFMYVTGVQETGAIDTMTVNRGVNSISVNHTAGTPIFGGWDEVEVQRGYAGTTPAAHNFLAPIWENVRTLTVNPSADVSEGSHFQIDSEKFSAVTAPDATGKLKAVRGILGTTMAAHNAVPAPITLIDGLGGTGLTLDYPTTHLDYVLMLPGTFLTSTGRAWDAGSCSSPSDLPGTVEVLCSTTGEFPLGAMGSGTVMNVGFTALQLTPGSGSVTVTPSIAQAVDTSGDPYSATAGPAATIRIYHCADFDTPPNFVVNTVDINGIRLKFNQPASPSNLIYDVDADGGNIDGADINLTRGQFNTRCYRP
jgi:hypothetical protein